MNKAIDPKLQEKITQWKKDLAELGKRNRLLHFQKEKKSTTEIPIAAAEIFEKLVIGEQPIPLNNLVDDDIDNRTINNNLTELYKGARDIFEQKGVKVLFLALGTLKWNFKDKPRDEIISPIILVPVELNKPSRKKEYELLSTDESIFINPALNLKLKYDYGIILNEEIDINKDLDYQKLLDRISQNEDISKRINDNNWEIEENIYLGLFDRKKVSMIKDLEYLEQQKDDRINNSILLGLANNREPYELSTPEIIPVENLDDCILPSSVLQILEADSSQQQVIEAAISGMSFIVQGPPGTGKSQTIVNLIAELIGQNKKVLVVAEKPVALQVVFDRLDKSGLEEAIINFSNKDIAKKSNFAKYLKNYRKDYEHICEEFDLNYIFYELTSSREILNKHSKILHKKWKPIEKSAFELYGELLKLQRECNHDVRFTFRNIHKWSYIQLVQAKKLIDKLVQYYPFIKCQQKTVWQQSNLTTLNSQKREEIYEGIDKLSQHIKLVRETGNKLAVLINKQTPQTLEELDFIFNAGYHIANFPLDKGRVREKGEFEDVFVQTTGFIDIPKVPKFWISNPNIKLLWQRLSELENDFNLQQEYYNYLVSKYDSSFFSQNLQAVLSICKQWNIFSWFSYKYWEDKRKILEYRKSKKFCSDEQIINDLEKAVRLQRIDYKFTDDSYRPRIAFENFFIGDKPDLFSIKLALVWFDELLQYKLSKKSISELISSENSRRELKNTLEKLNWQKHLTEINNEFNILRDFFDYPEKIINGSNSYFQNIPIDEIENFLETAANELDLFREWLDYQKNLNQLERMGLESFLDKIKESDASPSVWSTIFEKKFYYYWLQYIYDNSTELRCFNSKIHEDTITKFSQCKKGQNIKEIEKVTELALCHVQQNINLSLGIIAFSKKQASAIQKKIEELSQDNDELAEFCRDDSEKFFVKNLENVQGDEADVIILSFGYGRDKEGKFERKFGPINSQGGERRLNVAITRAKHKLILVASITPDMLSGVYSEGVICFKEYFEYIQQVEREKTEETNSLISSSNSLLVQDIAYALQKEGYEVETSLGASSYPIDLAVKNKQQINEFILGIECDGFTYNKYSTARDRDRLRRMVLEKMNWQIHRIWSKEWYHNREVQINLLLELLKQLEVQK
ncbi:hypothetical protein NIES267_29820 [Calothrix parasitica NIES-267]|uniref:RAP domain-containing protein n=1 Tax=Calothrix parasitica NIES-267 TaxID=1973488 RepID=A0A1Z4LQL2_9CYAN|nr:hypothetical protein NIES267_29820 [Calothrix parasitica NIES-267]